MRGVRWLLRPVLGAALGLGLAGSAAAHAADASRHGDPPASATILTSVSCRGSSFCMAAGVAGFFRRQITTEIWNGKTWHGLVTPAPRGAFQLSGVSCANRGRCVAVGGANGARPFALSWNGRRWRATKAIPAANTLSGISCPAAATCMAVGHTGALGNQRGSGLAELWNGQAWRGLSMPAVTGAQGVRLSSVACPSATSCIAVGSYVSSAAGNPLGTLAEAWDGTGWRVLAMPPAGSVGSSALSGVSCRTPSSCLAVGFDNFVQGSSEDALAERWDGQSWQVTAAAVPAGAEASSLAGVSCGSTGRCMAVGSYVGAVAGRGSSTLAEQWNGSAWQLELGPSPYNDLNQLAAVSCPAAANCTAVGGGDLFGITPADSLAEHWDGQRWRVQRSGQFDELSAVSCSSAARCAAVGGYISRSDIGLTLAQSWDGHRWRQRAAPTRRPFDAMSDVSCAGRSFCMAVGGGARGFAERWNGRHWRLVPIPVSSQLTSVSCPIATRCLAVGSAPDTALAWNGSRWRQVPPATVPHSVDSSLTDVACPSARRCIAVGSFVVDVHEESSLLAEEWNGLRWKLLQTPALARTAGALAGVACSGPANCMAVGGDIAEQWNGRTWRQRQTPVATSFGPGLLDVACPGASRCVAVGHYARQFASPDIGLTELWNGRTWRQVPPARRGDALAGVSCPAVTRCIAVGRAGISTRAELWNGSRWRLLVTANP